jgi:uncharacterized membrane protein
LKPAHSDPSEERPTSVERGDTSALSRWLARAPAPAFTLYAALAAFGAYMSMYAFRKPFTATAYDNIPELVVFGIAFGYKPIAIISQLFGYLLSKFLGIRFASAAKYRQRAPIVLGLIVFAELMLTLFGLTPAPANLVFLFLSGLPLGMVWSMLFGLLEGRRCTELLSLGMSVSVVFASGWVKSVGRFSIDSWSVPEFWMPAVTGLVFSPLLLLTLYLLHQLPPPTPDDVSERSVRKPMMRRDRRDFLREYRLGVVFLVFGYLCLMAYRNVRDDFMDVILRDLGHPVDASDFARIETIVGVAVIAVLCFLRLIKDNRVATQVNLLLITLGAVLLGVSTMALEAGHLDPEGFYTLNGIGLYIAFVPYQSILIDRLVGMLPRVATASFLMAIADSYGYVTVVATYLGRDVYQTLSGAELPWSDFLIGSSYVVMLLVPIATLGCWFAFRRALPPSRSVGDEP